MLVHPLFLVTQLERSLSLVLSTRNFKLQQSTNYDSRESNMHSPSVSRVFSNFSRTVKIQQTLFDLLNNLNKGIRATKAHGLVQCCIVHSFELFSLALFSGVLLF